MMAPATIVGPNIAAPTIAGPNSAPPTRRPKSPLSEQHPIGYLRQ